MIVDDSLSRLISPPSWYFGEIGLSSAIIHRSMSALGTTRDPLSFSLNQFYLNFRKFAVPLVVLICLNSRISHAAAPDMNTGQFVCVKSNNPASTARAVHVFYTNENHRTIEESTNWRMNLKETQSVLA